MIELKVSDVFNESFQDKDGRNVLIRVDIVKEQHRG